MDIIPDSNVYV